MGLDINLLSIIIMAVIGIIVIYAMFFEGFIDRVGKLFFILPTNESKEYSRQREITLQSTNNHHSKHKSDKKSYLICEKKLLNELVLEIEYCKENVRYYNSKITECENSLEQIISDYHELQNMNSTNSKEIDNQNELYELKELMDIKTRELKTMENSLNSELKALDDLNKKIIDN
ncbi:hypothetical protein [Methanococcus voltae]|uniref:Chromosome segregation ATPase n=1 Tax=Methanococcus voltae TaxID=2188 RepID=A0A8J7RNA9_METVO|nr:hypothetical protein [Methanococcus voltae]MBP2173167.1 chromosome segregation ATPase [Methanococcus voltae]MBP2202041.1 chromosome segregation ATPase [Methanococcus voltae]